jgi:hypothetical protein
VEKIESNCLRRKKEVQASEKGRKYLPEKKKWNPGKQKRRVGAHQPNAAH